MMGTQPSVFISYEREDKAHALRLVADLQACGAQVWIDTLELLPGQYWKHAIERAISTCQFFVPLLSKSISKTGYMQKELNLALELLKSPPIEDIFVIPARLEDCRPEHSQLADLQWVDLFDSWDEGVARIARSLGLINAPLTHTGVGFDPITGLISGNLFEHFLSMEVARARRWERGLALLYLCIDRLQDYADSHDSDLRDRLLRTCGVVLRSFMRTYDHVIRHTDDLFAIICFDILRENVLGIGERLRKYFEGQQIPIPFGTQISEVESCQVTLSIGIALFPDHGDTEKVIDHNAQQALQLAMEMGGNRLVLYSATSQQANTTNPTDS